MNEWLIPLLLITAIGLFMVLMRTFNKIETASHELRKHVTDSDEIAKRYAYLRTAKYVVYIPAFILGFAALVLWQIRREEKNIQVENLKKEALAQFDTAKVWEAPDPLSIQKEDEAKLIQYGRDLIAHTADYLGPEGIVKPMSNGMNCQNCHLEAASKPFGNNYSAVAATYPKFRARSGTAETIAKRVNDCFQRSLNGQALDSMGREMKAITAYIQWLGQAVPKGKTPKGAGLLKLPMLNRAANSDSGRIVYATKCASCHGQNGEGLPMPEGNRRRYPPLWGEHSYNEAAGLFRLSTFAGYVKANMPFGASYQNPQLSDTEAWDLAAFVNSQPRPKHPFLQQDWPKIDGKPFDHPFGPFADTFPEAQHKYGPFQPIVDFQKKMKEQKETANKGK
ncbi:MAG: c-type cytochrome [Saprospiraceae bacterium]|nr:c-type cytochrome [Saprospiraceae bacterium]